MLYRVNCRKSTAHRNLKFLILLITIAVSIFFTSCSNSEYDGDILAAIEEDSSSTIYFKKSAAADVSFSIKYKIDKDYDSSDLPVRESEELAEINPGYTLLGWKPLHDVDAYIEYLTVDSNGFITAFHMPPVSFTVYAVWAQTTTQQPGDDDAPDTPDTPETPDNPADPGTPDNPEDPGENPDTPENPIITVVVELPGLDEVGVDYSISGNTLTLTAVLPTGAQTSDYHYFWFYTNEGFGNVRSTSASWIIDTSSWAAGYYQITLLAERISDGMPSGKTVQIHKE